LPIEYFLDHERRLVVVRAIGTLTDEDVFGYQHEVWSRPDVQGYDELVDMTDVERIALPYAERVQDLAHLSVSMDTRSRASHLAVIAPSDVAFGIGRMYQTYRELDPQSTKQVGVFRTREEALAFLGIAELKAP
jgi:hypothetical protein